MIFTGPEKCRYGIQSHTVPLLYLLVDAGDTLSLLD